MTSFSEMFESYELFRNTFRDPSPAEFEEYEKMVAFIEFVEGGFPDVVEKYAGPEINIYDGRTLLAKDREGLAENHRSIERE